MPVGYGPTIEDEADRLLSLVPASLKELRKHTGVSLEELAFECGDMATSSLFRIESGETKNPKLLTMLRLAVYAKRRGLALELTSNTPLVLPAAATMDPLYAFCEELATLLATIERIRPDALPVLWAAMCSAIDAANRDL